MNVFVLGAGASAPAGMPLAADLGNRIRADLDEARGLGVWQRLEKLKIFDPERDFETNLTRLDLKIQEALRRGESTSVSAGPDGRSYDLPSFRGTTIPDALSKLLLPIQEAAQNEGRSAYLDRFVQKHVRPGDRIITFNYDLLVESALRRAGLWSLRDGYGVDLSESFRSLLNEPDSPVLVLKLHGSVEWFSIVIGQTLLVSMAGSRMLGYEGLEVSSQNVGKGITLPQVLPSFVKIMARYPLPRIWRAAAAALRDAERVLFVGYSFPFADSAAHTLFLTNCQQSSRLLYVWYRKTEETIRQVDGLRGEFAAADLRLADVHSCIDRLGKVDSIWEPQEAYCPDRHGA